MFGKRDSNERISRALFDADDQAVLEKLGVRFAYPTNPIAAFFERINVMKTGDRREKLIYTFVEALKALTLCIALGFFSLLIFCAFEQFFTIELSDETSKNLFDAIKSLKIHRRLERSDGSN